MLLLAEEGCDPVMTVMCSISHWRFHVGLLHRVVLNASKKSNAIRRAYYYERVTCISALMDLSAADVNPAVGLKACWSEKMLLRQNWIKIPSSDNLLQGSAHDRTEWLILVGIIGFSGRSRYLWDWCYEAHFPVWWCIQAAERQIITCTYRFIIDRASAATDLLKSHGGHFVG